MILPKQKLGEFLVKFLSESMFLPIMICSIDFDFESSELDFTETKFLYLDF